MSKVFRKKIKHLRLHVTADLLNKMREVENTFGRITPDSKEYKKAQQYLEALKNYPNISSYYRGINFQTIKAALNVISQYKNNLLEKDARAAAAKYKPTFMKTIKTIMKELYKVILN